MPAALRRLLRRAGILAFAVFVGGAVGVVANARAQPAGDGIRPGRSILVCGDTNHVLVGRRSLAGVAGVNLVGLAPKTLRRATTGRYVVVVRVARRSGALGPAARAALRIVA